jgi:hypothetical protein
MIASASDGDFGSGGIATCTYERKLAIERTFLSKSTNTSASWAFRRTSSSAVLAGSPQKVTDEPSGIGAWIRTSGVIVSNPNRASLRSLITDERSRPTVGNGPGAWNPGAGSPPRRIPPVRSARSRTRTLRPPFAR